MYFPFGARPIFKGELLNFRGVNESTIKQCRWWQTEQWNWPGQGLCSWQNCHFHSPCNEQGRFENEPMICLVGGFNPFEKHWSKWGSFPQIGVKIKHIWNHQLRTHDLFTTRTRGVHTIQTVWSPGSSTKDLLAKMAAADGRSTAWICKTSWLELERRKPLVLFTAPTMAGLTQWSFLVPLIGGR